MTALRRAQVQLGATVLFALVLSAVLGVVAGPSRPVAACGRLVVASSAEKFRPLSSLAAAYNAAPPGGSRCVRVVVEAVIEALRGGLEEAQRFGGQASAGHLLDS